MEEEWEKMLDENFEEKEEEKEEKIEENIKVNPIPPKIEEEKEDFKLEIGEIQQGKKNLTFEAKNMRGLSSIGGIYKQPKQIAEIKENLLTLKKMKKKEKHKKQMNNKKDPKIDKNVSNKSKIYLDELKLKPSKSEEIKKLESQKEFLKELSNILLNSKPSSTQLEEILGILKNRYKCKEEEVKEHIIKEQLERGIFNEELFFEKSSKRFHYIEETSKRVEEFKPDNWQIKLLDIVDELQSALGKIKISNFFFFSLIIFFLF